MDYVIIDQIGKGSYSSVYKIKVNNKEYAMKKIEIFDLTSNQKIYILNELKIISKHKCAYIIKFYHAFIQENSINIIMEYSSNGTLDDYMKKNILDNATILKLFSQLCAATSYLHKNNVIHRDIKSSNILIDKENNVKLIDFGVSKILHKYMKFTKSFVGTPLYMGPELFKNVMYDCKIDTWSIGIVLFQMTHNTKLPFECKTFEELKLKINSPNIKYDKTILPLFKHIITKCIQPLPQKRIKLDALLSYKEIKEKLNVKKVNVEPHIYQVEKIPLHKDDWRNFLTHLPNHFKENDDSEENDDGEENNYKSTLLKTHSKHYLIKLNQRLLDIITEKNKELEKLNKELKKQLCKI
jgi:serine/threonine protein kinase